MLYLCDITIPVGLILTDMPTVGFAFFDTVVQVTYRADLERCVEVHRASALMQFGLGYSAPQA